jgi:hypothetical protein
MSEHLENVVDGAFGRRSPVPTAMILLSQSYFGAAVSNATEVRK